MPCKNYIADISVVVSSHSVRLVGPTVNVLERTEWLHSFIYRLAVQYIWQHHPDRLHKDVCPFFTSTPAFLSARARSKGIVVVVILLCRVSYVRLHVV